MMKTKKSYTRVEERRDLVQQLFTHCLSEDCGILTKSQLCALLGRWNCEMPKVLFVPDDLPMMPLLVPGRAEQTI